MPKAEKRKLTLKPYFVYKMKGAENEPLQPTRRRTTKKRAKVNLQTSKLYIHVGKSRAPLRKVQRHNRSTVRIVTNRKLMNKVKGNWRLEEWFGPFDSREDARFFQRQWTNSLRKQLLPPQPAEAKYYSTRANCSKKKS